MSKDNYKTAWNNFTTVTFIPLIWSLRQERLPVLHKLQKQFTPRFKVKAAHSFFHVLYAQTMVFGVALDNI